VLNGASSKGNIEIGFPHGGVTVNRNIIKRSILVFLLSFFITHPTPSPGKELNIALLLWRGETMAEKGFIDGLREFGYTTEFSTFDVSQDLTKLGNALSYIASQSDAFDYVYTFGTTISRRTQIIINNKIPQLFNVVTDPVGAGIMGGNISGASDAVPVSKLLEIINELFRFQKLGLFFNPREKNSMLSRKEIYTRAKVLGIEVVDFRSPPVEQILHQNLQKLADNPAMIDAVYLPSDSFLVSNATLIGARLQSLKILSFGSVRNYIEAGVLMGFVVDYYELGKSVAAIVDRNQRGEALQQIPVVRADFTLMINQTTSDLLGVKIPEFESLKTKIIP
jgi:putative ABC transport system substrate-binding protein